MLLGAKVCVRRDGARAACSAATPTHRAGQDRVSHVLLGLRLQRLLYGEDLLPGTSCWGEGESLGSPCLCPCTDFSLCGPPSPWSLARKAKSLTGSVLTPETWL